jgi:hypothetical protein
MVPLREPPELASTLYSTRPLPLPVRPDCTLIHASLLRDVH